MHLLLVEHPSLVHLLYVVLELYLVVCVDVLFLEDFLPSVEIFCEFSYLYRLTPRYHVVFLHLLDRAHAQSAPFCS